MGMHNLTACLLDSLRTVTQLRFTLTYSIEKFRSQVRVMKVRTTSLTFLRCSHRDLRAFVSRGRVNHKCQTIIFARERDIFERFCRYTLFERLLLCQAFLGTGCRWRGVLTPTCGISITTFLRPLRHGTQLGRQSSVTGVRNPWCKTWYYEIPRFKFQTSKISIYSRICTTMVY